MNIQMITGRNPDLKTERCDVDRFRLCHPFAQNNILFSAALHLAKQSAACLLNSFVMSLTFERYCLTVNEILLGRHELIQLVL